MRQSLLLLEQLEEGLLGLLLTLEELPVKVGGLLGQALEGGQVFLGGVEGESQAGRRRRTRAAAGRQLAAGFATIRLRVSWTSPTVRSSTGCGDTRRGLAWPFE